jgi:hypothetical protein
VRQTSSFDTGEIRLPRASKSARRSLAANLESPFRDFRLQKSSGNLDTVRQTPVNVTDRSANFQAQAMDVHTDFPLFQRLALPVASVLR